MGPTAMKEVLGYERAGAEGTRPAGVIVMGVLSVMVGVVMIGAGVRLCSEAGRYYAVARPIPRGSIPIPTTQLSPFTGDVVGARGLPRGGRDVVVGVVKSRFRTALDADREAVLRRLMGEYGADVFPAGAGSADAVRGAVIEMGQLPGGPDGVGQAGTIWFRTAGGLVWVDDARANFRPEGTRTTVCVDGDSVTDASGGRWRNSVSIAEEMALLHKRTGGRVGANQAAGLVQHLRTTPAPAVMRSARGRYWSPGWTELGMGGVPRYDPPGDVSMQGRTLLYGQDLTVLPNGYVCYRFRPRLDPYTGEVLPPLPIPRRAPWGAPVSAGIALAGIVEAVSKAVLGIWLLWCGVTMLKGSERAARRHVVWAWAAFASAAWSASLAPALVDEAKNRVPVALGSAGWVVAGIAYPIVVLLAMKDGRIRRFYEARGASAALVPIELRRRRWPRVAAALRRPNVRAALGAVQLAAVAMAVAHWAWADDGTWGVGRAWRSTMAFGCMVSALLCAWVASLSRAGGEQ